MSGPDKENKNLLSQSEELGNKPSTSTVSQNNTCESEEEDDMSDVSSPIEIVFKFLLLHLFAIAFAN